MLLVIDNYDSFTYNLVQYFGELGAEMEIFRNDQISIDEIRAKSPEKICISPGPCTPDDAGISCEVIREFGESIPMLGVCLGHQSIGQVFGGDVVRADRLMHGKTSPILHEGEGVFAGLENPFEATRYHSLIVKRETFPDCLEILAETAEGEIMGLRHREHPIHGVQFHPESILTGEGKKLLKNFFGFLNGLKRQGWFVKRQGWFVKGQGWFGNLERESEIFFPDKFERTRYGLA